MRLTVATSQFPVSADIGANGRWILQHMQDAKEQGANVIHFPEGALSGYAGTDFRSFETFDWDLLLTSSEAVLAQARVLEMWVLLGSAHHLTVSHKPHNAVYVIDDGGHIVDRYDKRFCAGDASEEAGDLAHYTPGNHFAVFEIGGVRCGVLICHEYRYPELYRQYKRRGVQVVFHSYHAGNIPPDRWTYMREQVGEDYWSVNPRTTLPGITMPATMQAAAANNYLWISCSNSSAQESCWPAFFVRPDGVKTGELTRNRPGLLLTTVDTEAPWYDSTRAWRDRAIEGTYHSGTLVEDPRSQDRRRL